MTPWKRFLTNIADLFTVKGLITFAIVITLCYQVIRGEEIRNEFIILAVTAIINYYFPKGGGGKQENENGKDGENE